MKKAYDRNRLALAAGVIAFLAAVVSISLRVDLNYDELTYVIGGATALRNFATLTFAPEYWSFEFHPPFMMYFYGLSFSAFVFLKTLLTQGIVPLNELAVQAAVIAKEDFTLQFFRIPSFLAGAMTVFFAYRWCERILGSAAAGLFSVFFLITLPPFLGMSSIAYLEIGMALTQTLAAYYFMLAVKEKDFKKYIASAVFVGLAAGTKIFAGAIGFVIFIYMLRIAAAEARDGGLGGALQRLKDNKKILLWFFIVPLTLYAVWPWLWTNPMLFFRNLGEQMTFHGHGFYKGTSALGHDYYLLYLLVSTPLPFLTAALAGVFFMWRRQRDTAVFFIIWIVFAVGVITISKGKHGGYRHILPIFVPLSIFAGHGAYNLLGLIKEARSRAFSFAGRALAAACALWLLYSNLSVFPYQSFYFNELAGGPKGAYGDYIFADTGAGQKEAIRYIDANAPAGSSVWIWGTKPNAFMYSRRVNIGKSLEDGVIFTARSAHNMSQNETIYPKNLFDSGDLVFRFPYFDEKSASIPEEELKRNNVSYVVVHRLFSYPGITPGKGQEELMRMIMKKYRPEFTFEMLGIPVCWVYRVG